MADRIYLTLGEVLQMHRLIIFRDCRGCWAISTASVKQSTASSGLNAPSSMVIFIVVATQPRTYSLRWIELS